jgi:hypothetical protein
MSFSTHPSLGNKVAIILSRVHQLNDTDTKQHSLNFTTLRCENVFPIVHRAGYGEYECDVHSGILNTDAPVRAAAKDEVVPWVCVRRILGVQPAFGEEIVGFGVDFRVMQRIIERRNDHAIRGDGVVIGDRERLRGFVGDL